MKKFMDGNDQQLKTMIGRLLSLGLTQIDQYTLTKESLELVDKEFTEVKTKKKNFFLNIKIFILK